MRAGRRKLLIHVAFGVIGLGALGLLIRGVGAATLASILRASARWVPLLFAIDALRIVAEAVVTRSLSAHVRVQVPLGELARIHLVGYAAAMTMPAGRATGEAVKAAMLSRFIGLPEAAAVGAANQGMAMLGNALIAVPCAAAALYMTGPSPLSGAVVVYTLVALALFTALQIACRRPEIGGALFRRLSKMDQGRASFHDALARIPVLPPVATLATFVSRAVAAVELAILLWILGGRHGVGEALLAQGVSLLGGSIGDLVPGQLGATDGAFALAAPWLGLAIVDGIAIATLLHCVQAIWAAIGWAAPFFWRAPAPPRGAPESADRASP